MFMSTNLDSQINKWELEAAYSIKGRHFCLLPLPLQTPSCFQTPGKQAQPWCEEAKGLESFSLRLFIWTAIAYLMWFEMKHVLEALCPCVQMPGIWPELWMLGWWIPGKGIRRILETGWAAAEVSLLNTE